MVAWQQLFFEKRLSQNGIKSCAGCHAPELAFTDGYRRSLGTSADLLQRNTPSLLNLSSYKTFNWANPELTSIDLQILHPLFNTNPSELGGDVRNISTHLTVLSRSSQSNPSNIGCSRMIFIILHLISSVWRLTGLSVLKVTAISLVLLQYR